MDEEAAAREEADREAACFLTQLRVRPGDEFILEAAAQRSASSVLLVRREAARQKLTLSYNELGSQDMEKSIVADGRATLAELKTRIARELGVPAEGLRMRRAPLASLEREPTLSTRRNVG